MRILIYILTILMLSACTSTRKLQEELHAQEDLRPSWVRSRPISSMDYIGIGQARKQGNVEEYQKMARNNALNDLASEIEVRVSSNSLLYTLEHDERFSENYSQSIMTSSDLRLEGFEVSDSYEDENAYWAFYRLDKQRYEEIKAAWKNEALSRASQHLVNARSARASGDLRAASSHFIESLEELQAYWGEENLVDVESSTGGSEQIAIDRVALEEFAEMRSAFRLRSNVELVQLDASNDFRFPVEVTAELDGKAAIPMPIVQRMGSQARTVSISDQLNILVRPGEKGQTVLRVSADPFEEARKRVRRTGLAFMESMLQAEIQLIDIFTVYPAVTLITTQQGIDGGRGRSTILRSAVIEGLSQLDIQVDEKGESPYTIEVNAISRDGGTAQTFNVVYTDVTITAGDRKEGSTAYSTRLESVKGVHNNTMDASNLSLRKSADKIDKNLLKPLVSAMF